MAIAVSATVSVTTALARSSSPSANCANRSIIGPARFQTKDSVVVGPLSFPTLAVYAPAAVLDNRAPWFWMKSPVIVRAGHTVTIKIAGDARRSTGFVGFGGRGGTTLADSRGIVTFTACGRHQSSGSSVGGQPVTFWPGGFVAPPAPVCVPLDFYVDHSRAAQRVVVSLAAGACPGAP